MNTFYELSRRALNVARTIRAVFKLLHAFAALVIIVLMTRYFGFNIITCVIDVILVALVIPSVIAACEMFTQVQIEKAPDRRIHLATSRRARRAALHRQGEREQGPR